MQEALGDVNIGWAKTQGNSSLFVGKALLKALRGGLPKNGTAGGLEKQLFVNVQAHGSPK